MIFSLFHALRPIFASAVFAFCSALGASEPAIPEAEPLQSMSTGDQHTQLPSFPASLYESILDEAVLPIPADSGDLSFKAAREAFRKGRLEQLEQLSLNLQDYPLHDYLTLWVLTLKLRRDIDNPAINAAFIDFIDAKDGQYIAERAAADYLEIVGDRINPTLFNRLYRNLRWNQSEPVLQAWYFFYNFNSTPLKEIKHFLRDTPFSGEAVRTLTDRVLQADPDWAWPVLVIQMQKQKWREVRRLLDILPAQALPGPKRDLQAILNNPQGWYRKNRGRLRIKPARLGVFLLLRLARKDLDLATEASEKILPRLAAQWQSLLQGIMAYEALVALKPDAAQRFAKAGTQMYRHPLLVTPELMSTWAVRAFLRSKDWSSVEKSILSMPIEMRQQEPWIYWLARSHKALGKSFEAEQLFRLIASNCSFYGKLSADALNIPYASPTTEPANPSEPELNVWRNRKGLQRAEAFYRLELYSFGHRERHWQMRGPQRRRHSVLAAYAKEKHLVHRMINTGRRADGENYSLSQTFPTPQLSLISRLAVQEGLPVSWVYGIIRQESRFMPTASSAVGARGLMQIMPATAKWITKKLGRRPVKRNELSALEPNLELGTAYLRLLRDGFEGSYILATAAYNAGPARARAWRKSLSEPMEAAVFIETIPFFETRDYVKNVLSNMKTYSQRLNTDIGNFSQFLGCITPGDSAGSSELF